jgi:hypothetical protein
VTKVFILDFDENAILKDDILHLSPAIREAAAFQAKLFSN